MAVSYYIEDAACGWIDANDQMLLVTCTRYPQLEARENACVLALFAGADNSLIKFQIILSFI